MAVPGTLLRVTAILMSYTGWFVYFESYHWRKSSISLADLMLQAFITGSCFPFFNPHPINSALLNSALPAVYWIKYAASYFIPLNMLVPLPFSLIYLVNSHSSFTTSCKRHLLYHALPALFREQVFSLCSTSTFYTSPLIHQMAIFG